MEPENTTTPESKQRKRLTRSRVLLGMVVLCLLLWSIKAIHHAMQPKYQGKTAQEWFGAYETREYCGLTALALKDFIQQDQQKQVAPFKAMGTNGVWFLWHEYRRKDSPFNAWFMREKANYLGSRTSYSLTHEEERKYNALSLLRLLGPDAEPLIPVILPQLLSTDKQEVANAANLLGRIQRQPGTVVPALVQSMLVLRQTKATDRLSHIESIGNYGHAALPALPVLRSKLMETNTHVWEISALNRAILKINGPGPELAYFTNQLKQGNYFLSEDAIRDLTALGTNARPAAPVLLEFAKSLRRQDDVTRIMSAIRTIDPEGLYQKP